MSCSRLVEILTDLHWGQVSPYCQILVTKIANVNLRLIHVLLSYVHHRLPVGINYEIRCSEGYNDFLSTP